MDAIQSRRCAYSLFALTLFISVHYNLKLISKLGYHEYAAGSGHSGHWDYRPSKRNVPCYPEGGRRGEFQLGILD
jgi:hypothetical protein